MTTKVEHHANRFVIEFGISGLAAGVSKTIASPIEVIKSRLQLQQALLEKGTIKNPYGGIIDCFKRLYQEEGMRAYYKGNLTNVLRYFPTQAFNFAFKDFFARKMSKGQGNADFWTRLTNSMVSGSIAGASTQFFVYPLDYTRVRLTNDVMSGSGKKQFNGIMDCMRATYHSDGIRGIYRGFLVTCFYMMLYRGCYFGLNDSIKPTLPHWVLDSLFYNFLVGYAITVTSGIFSYPFDTVRRRMMMSSGEKHIFTSSFDCFRFLYQWHGLPAFFGGVGANVLRGVTGAGVLTIYDRLQTVLFGKQYVVSKE